MGRNGMVTSAHYLASMAGLRVMMDGGNAVDAAVAVAAALSVVEPYMSGLGGDGLMSISPPGASAPVVLDYSGGAPREIAIDAMTPAAVEAGPRSLLVPGAPAGWLAALERYGTLPPARVFADAIALAEQGAPVSFRNTEFITLAAERIRDDPYAAPTFLPNGDVPRPGSVLRQPNLARTLRRLADGNASEFYSGALGREVVAAVRAAGGWLSEADLRDFRVAWQEPLAVDFHAYRVYAPPPPCAGFQYLQALKLLEEDDLPALGHNSAGYIHRFVETVKLAVADRIAYTWRDDVDTHDLLDGAYLRERRRLVDPSRAALGPGERYQPPQAQDPAVVRPGRVPARRSGEHTTHFAAMDRDGMAVNVTQSLGNPFGSGFMAGETGLMLNNFLYWTDLDPTSPNALAPGKKMENCMSPPQVYRDGRVLMTMGTPGSWGILQTQPQAILNVLAFGMNVQEAIEAPRVRHMGGFDVAIEGRVPDAVVAELERRGHHVERLPDYTWLVGGMHGIYRDPETGIMLGGADPRRDGYAVGW
jgi:gamma-glutamyltranspeptidase/glutathione hydrolase